MTHSTKAIYRLLLSDYVKVSKVSVEDMLYDENDIIRSMDKIEVSYINILFIGILLFLFAILFFCTGFF
jgi:Cft2 family RNA processing exonuclease